jgi:hypothetical protein
MYVVISYPKKEPYEVDAVADPGGGAGGAHPSSGRLHPRGAGLGWSRKGCENPPTEEKTTKILCTISAKNEKISPGGAYRHPPVLIFLLHG